MEAEAAKRAEGDRLRLVFEGAASRMKDMLARQVDEIMRELEGKIDGIHEGEHIDHVQARTHVESSILRLQQLAIELGPFRHLVEGFALSEDEDGGDEEADDPPEM